MATFIGFVREADFDLWRLSAMNGHSSVIAFWPDFSNLKWERDVSLLLETDYKVIHFLVGSYNKADIPETLIY